MTTDSWYGPIRRLHFGHFDDPWNVRLEAVNRFVQPHMKRPLYLHGDRLAPPWFNGNIEALEPMKWVLVVSLNPHINPRDRRYHLRDFTAQEWWDHWRSFNRSPSNWSGQFFPRLVNLAARSLGEEAPTLPEAVHRFATERMLFIEFCPYASAGFAGMSWPRWQEVAREDIGFQLKRDVRQIAFDHGQPSLVLCNGQMAAYDVKTQQFDVDNMYDLELALPDHPERTMRVFSSVYRPKVGDPFPVLGFNQLGRRGSSPSREIEILLRYQNDQCINIRILAEPRDTAFC